MTPVDATFCGMARVRISTTVDAERLTRARNLLPGPDSALMDRALSGLIDLLESEQELRALREHPYEDDAELSWEVPPGPDLAYDGEVPAEVQRLAAARRRGR